MGRNELEKEVRGIEDKGTCPKSATTKESDKSKSLRTLAVAATSISGLLILLTFLQIALCYTFQNPLVRAIQWGNAKAVEELIAKGHEPNEKIGRKTPLTYTILHSIHTPSWVLEGKCKTRYMEKIEANIETMMAIVDVIIKNGADINELDDDGKAILHYAISRSVYAERRAKVVELLLSKGADVNLKDGTGYTPLHLAIEGWHSDLEMVEILVDNGADINAKLGSGNGHGRTPLKLAIEEEEEEIAELLRKRGAKE